MMQYFKPRKAHSASNRIHPSTVSGVLLGLIFFGLMGGCDGDYRQLSTGAIDEVFVVMDSTAWNSETAEAIREVFGGGITTLPAPEPRYRVTFREFRTNKQLEQVKQLRNVIFAAPLDQDGNTANFIRSITSDDVENRILNNESFAFPLRNQWYRDQWTLILSSSGDEQLADMIRRSEQALLEGLQELELQRWEQEVFRRAEQTEISDALWSDYGWSVRMQHDYVQTVDTTDVVVFRRYLPKNNRWIWAWWDDGFRTPEEITPEWIHAKRDSVMQIYIRGDREGSYVTTEYRRDLVTTQLEWTDDWSEDGVGESGGGEGERGGERGSAGDESSGWVTSRYGNGSLIGFETLGTWRMTQDFMGGAFVNFTYFDPQSERLFMIEYSQFAPGISKRRFIRQFQAMGRTFRSDPNWRSSKQSGTN